MLAQEQEFQQYKNQYKSMERQYTEEAEMALIPAPPAPPAIIYQAPE